MYGILREEEVEDALSKTLFRPNVSACGRLQPCQDPVWRIEGAMESTNSDKEASEYQLIAVVCCLRASTGL